MTVDANIVIQKLTSQIADLHLRVALLEAEKETLLEQLKKAKQEKVKK